MNKRLLFWLKVILLLIVAGIVAGAALTGLSYIGLLAIPPFEVRYRDASGAAAEARTTTATLNVTVNPNGYPTTAWFQWGTTATYGNVTSVADLGRISTRSLAACGTSAISRSIPAWARSRAVAAENA